jgi:hypothetical protein
VRELLSDDVTVCPAMGGNVRGSSLFVCLLVGWLAVVIGVSGY